MSILAPLIGAGAALAGQGINTATTANLNRKTQQWNEHMYKIQREDNLNFWNMNNSYNSPQAQMARLQDAGLNPNLVYGNGAVGNSSSTPHAPSPLSFRPNTPQVDLPSIVDTYFDVKQKQAVIDNLKKQGDNLVLDGALKAADAKSKDLSNSFLENTLDVRIGNESKKSAFLGEQIVNKALLNLYQGGVESSNLIGTRKRENGAFDRNLKGLDLINELRSQQKNRNVTEQSRAENKLQYEKRTLGTFGDMTSKDWVNMILGAIGKFR